MISLVPLVHYSIWNNKLGAMEYGSTIRRDSHVAVFKLIVNGHSSSKVNNTFTCKAAWPLTIYNQYHANLYIFQQLVNNQYRRNQ